MKTATIKCSECDYSTKPHYTFKGAVREVRKTNGIYSSGAVLCPVCNRSQTLTVIIGEETKHE